jgi:hypothetical protein
VLARVEYKSKDEIGLAVYAEIAMSEESHSDAALL